MLVCASHCSTWVLAASSVMLETDHGCCCLQGLDSALEVELQAGEMLYLPAGPLQQPSDRP